MSGRLVQELAERLRPTLEKTQVRRAILFGSLARGEQSRRSDVDLLIVQETDEFLERYDPLLREITQVVAGRDVDLLIYTPQELEETSDRPLIARALKEGKVLYESEQESTPG